MSCIAAGPVDSVGVGEPPVGGTGAGMRGGDVRVDGVGMVGVVSGMAGNGGTAVCVLIASFTSTRATTNATTSKTAAPATIHSQRGGGFGPRGGGAAWGCSWPDAGSS
ncbi:hypothetical protein A9X02_27050, partial [Mycobacterium malmoense]